MSPDTEPLEMEAFDCVWDAICKTPQEANQMRARSDLMRHLQQILKESHWTHAFAAKRCGISIDMCKRLRAGRFNDFSLRLLMNIAASLGYRTTMSLEHR